MFDIFLLEYFIKNNINLYKQGVLFLPMANIKSQKKRIKTNEQKRLRNSSIHSRMKSMTQKALQGLNTNGEQRESTVKQAISSIDRACSKGVIHPNTAARRKSRLMKHVNKVIG